MATYVIWVRTHNNNLSQLDFKNGFDGVWMTTNPEAFETPGLRKDDLIQWMTADAQCTLLGIKRYTQGPNASDPDLIGPVGTPSEPGSLAHNASAQGSGLEAKVISDTANLNEHYIVHYRDGQGIEHNEDPRLRMGGG